VKGGKSPARKGLIEEDSIGKVYDSRLMARLGGYLRPYGKWVFASVCLLLAHSAVSVAGPYFTKVVVDSYLQPDPGASSLLDPWLPEQPLEGLNFVAVLYLSALGLGFVFRYWQTYLMHNTGQRVMYDLRKDIYRHLQRMGVGFFDRSPVGRLVTRVTTDVETLNEMVTSGVVAIFGDVVTLAFILAAMIHLSPELTLAAFAVVPLVLLATLWFRRRARAAFRQVRTAVAKINAFLQERITGIAVVQLFNHERRSHSQFDEINAEHFEAQRNAIRAHALFFPIVEWLGVLAVSVVLVYGGGLVIEGALTLGVVVAFIQYGTRVFRPIQDLSEKYNILQAAMASSERIFKLLDTPAAELPSAALEQETGQPAKALQQAEDGRTAAERPAGLRVEFRNVWFAYKDEQWVLRDVSFTVEPGEMLAVVGHTGAGKTTLINLLLRFYEPQRGEIFAGGREVRQWDRSELRRQFGIVLQDPYIFQGSVESNITLGDERISRQRLEEVVRQVNLAHFVASLPGGLDEPVRERGSSLSSGQQQLVGFARALARNPRFLILDEATSSVDTETEFRIRDALGQVVSEQTSIVIAHRLSTIQRAHRILVMHKGAVREIGTHRELMEKQGIYWRLYQLQYKDQDAALAESPELAAELREDPELGSHAGAQQDGGGNGDGADAAKPAGASRKQD